MTALSRRPRRRRSVSCPTHSAEVRTQFRPAPFAWYSAMSASRSSRCRSSSVRRTRLATPALTETLASCGPSGICTDIDSTAARMRSATAVACTASVPGQQAAEFLAAVARQQRMFRRARQQRLHDPAQDFVAGRVSMLVVQFLEMVDIEEHQRGGRACRRAFQRFQQAGGGLQGRSAHHGRTGRASVRWRHRVRRCARRRVAPALRVAHAARGCGPSRRHSRAAAGRACRRHRPTRAATSARRRGSGCRWACSHCRHGRVPRCADGSRRGATR